MELAKIIVQLNRIRNNIKILFGSRRHLLTRIKLSDIVVIEFHYAPWLRNRRLRSHVNWTRSKNAVTTINIMRSLRIVNISIILLVIEALRLCRCWLLLKHIYIASFRSNMKWCFCTPRWCHYSNSMTLLNLLIIDVAILPLIGWSSVVRHILQLKCLFLWIEQVFLTRLQRGVITHAKSCLYSSIGSYLSSFGTIDPSMCPVIHSLLKSFILVAHIPYQLFLTTVDVQRISLFTFWFCVLHSLLIRASFWYFVGVIIV